MKWISTKDKLPQDHERVLAVIPYSFTNGYTIKPLSYTSDLYKLDKYDFPKDKGRGGFYDYDSEWGYCEYEDVLYWMLYPELPKELRNEFR